jgi:hypothetical protein
VNSKGGVSKDKRAYHKAWRQKNRDKIQEYYQRFIAKDPERARRLGAERSKRYRKRHPERSVDRSLKTKAYRKNWFLLKKFGITVEQRNAILKNQGNVCAGCGSDTPNWKGDWHVDHCHSTGFIRGILCHNCNTALGRVKDDPEVLRSLARYLESNGKPQIFEPTQEVTTDAEHNL